MSRRAYIVQPGGPSWPVPVHSHPLPLWLRALATIGVPAAFRRGPRGGRR